MINPTETTFALILLNLALELLLYSIAVVYKLVYKLVMHKALKLGILESCFPIFAPLVIPPPPYFLSPLIGLFCLLLFLAL